MSKIEKALRKAQRESKAVVRTPGLPLPADASRDTEPEKHRDGGRPISVGASSTIALMHQPETMLPSERALNKIILANADDSPARRALRSIRTRIAQRVGTGGSVILVTSVRPAGGTSFMAINLGAAIGLDSAKTSLLIDCNIRRPSLHDLVKGKRKKGLTDYLTGGGEEIGDIICPTGIERLRVITVGERVDHGSEYFTGERMHRLIWSVRERYPDRQVILDCPPLHTPDTQILLQQCDHVLVVVPYGEATESQVRAAVRLIDPAKLLGVVVNDEPHVPTIDWRSLLRSIVARFLRLGKRRAASP